MKVDAQGIYLSWSLGVQGCVGESLGVRVRVLLGVCGVVMFFVVLCCVVLCCVVLCCVVMWCERCRGVL